MLELPKDVWSWRKAKHGHYNKNSDVCRKQYNFPHMLVSKETEQGETNPITMSDIQHHTCCKICAQSMISHLQKAVALGATYRLKA